jgi:hypothetical protein
MRTGPRTAETQAIFRFIQANEPVTQKQLMDHFRSEAAAAGMSTNSWLGRRVDAMCDADFIQFGAHGWTAATDVQLHEPVTGGGRARKGSQPAARAPAPADTSIAQPRRVTMFGPNYVPPVQIHRAGSNDYAAAPSLINGQQRSYRRGW